MRIRMKTPKPFEELEFKTLDDFQCKYNELLRNSDLFEYVFRGQSESVWGLVPSILRKLGNGEVLKCDLIDTIKQEFLGVSEFIKTADKSGFDFPGGLEVYGS